MSAATVSAPPRVAIPAEAQRSPFSGTTTVELTWVEQATERWIRFGVPVLDQVVDRRRRLLSFAADNVFAFVRWASNDYGTLLSRLDIVRTVGPGEAYSTLPCVSPGGELLLHLGGWPKVRACLELIDEIEDLGVDPCAVAPDYWRHAHNRLIAGHTPRAYSLARHRAWLLRRELTA
ncbi:DUF2840 domain-containing protein [Sphingomonas suaedae]|uniref:DUF2840 domain-containing protein n=1 Tax=Sphingomonas suaedae TaxID=2599297 RepID=A0A518RHR4_9SPHN|nr:DUF2840 domain-containing protein [Sphingomonas suaedae]QDX27008.1 DUF2840 domain-containing protein [Sphingomonas suaedae]